MEFDNSKSLLNIKSAASPIGVGDGLVADPELVRKLSTPGGSVEPETSPSDPKSSPSSSGTKSNSSSGTDESKKEKVGETGVKSIAQTIMDIAAEMGGQAQTEAKKIAERDVLLSQLFTKYGGNEQDVIDFINKSLFEVQLSHEELIDLTNITNQASTKSGQKLKDINNFALEHIRRIQNPELTKTVIEEASSLKSMFRNIPIFEILANDLSPGSYPNAEQYIDNPLMFGKDPANFLLFQELRGMIVQRNAEQVELIRREFQIKLRQKQKAIEVANKKRAIVEMMESIEYLNAETAAVNKISEIF